MAARASQLAKAGWKIRMARWAYETSDFRKYGLYSQDTYNEALPEVKLAVERLPEKQYNERLFRISRALQLSNQKIFLPKEEWTTFEDDLENRYLTGLLEKVKAELKEEKEWATKA